MRSIYRAGTPISLEISGHTYALVLVINSPETNVGLNLGEFCTTWFGQFGKTVNRKELPALGRREKDGAGRQRDKERKRGRERCV